MISTKDRQAPDLRVADGRVLIDVDWDDADELRHHFVTHGMPGTVSLDPPSRKACLELWDAPEPDQARAVLADWSR
jgi:hypothetical protein